MGKKKVAKRSRLKPFVKLYNYNHILPTRYSLDIENFKSEISLQTLEDPTHKENAKKAVKRSFEEKYQAGQNKWFFQKIRF